MSLPELEDAILLEDPDPVRLEKAADFLEKSIKVGNQDSCVYSLLAQAYKKLGKIPQARAALRNIKKADGSVLFQMALLSLKENNLAQAEVEFQQSLDLDRNCFQTCYNLVLTKLSLGKIESCLELMPHTIELAKKSNPPQAGFQNPAFEVDFLQDLERLLKCTANKGNGILPADLDQLTPRNENRLMVLIRRLGNIDSVVKILSAFVEAKPRSGPVREAYVEAILIKAKWHVDRCQWHEAEQVLKPLVGDKSPSRATQVSLLNLLGCCSVMTQDLDMALVHFHSALKMSPLEARLVQNLALTYEILGDQSQAEPYWNRFFDLLENKITSPGENSEYFTNLAHESLIRQGIRLTDKEKWNQALGFVIRASRLRPDCPETIERLFHLYNHNKQGAEARRTLERLRRLRPRDPQLDLYELDLVEMKNLTDIDRMLGEIDTIIKRYPGDPRVEERAVSMVGNVIPLMSNLCDQLNEQIGKVIEQVRNLPNYQINWPAVREVMRDRLKEFQKLRKITAKCLPLITNDEHRRIINELGEHIDKKMEVCRSMGT